MEQRARLHDPRFSITAANLEPARQLCRRLEGIPLAIELAAPRLRHFIVLELVTRLDRSLDGRTGGRPGLAGPAARQ